ncbi:MAG: oxidoreductase [Verrucomicrobiaceae bacterium TMED76]|nr:MAG: oxidoreductase [Verrucomicrobiaceae bacterium TMED76]
MENKKLIAITGASSGIGAAMAKAFSLAGYPLLLMARRIELMEAMSLPNAICKKVDVLDLEGMKDAISEAEEIHGKVDCMINNAGVMINGKPQSQNPEDWQKMLDVNIRGVLNGIHLVLKDMVDRQTGTIINMGSIAGIKTFPDHTVYCGTKFAVHAITENIREEVSGSNVRLINIAPGMAYTELLDHGCEEEARKGWMDYAEQIGGALKPESIAQSVLFSYQMPQEVCVREIVICPTGQEP